MGVRDEVDRATGSAERFTQFARAAEPRLRIALAAAMGPDVGADATAEALAWGWQNWDRLEAMENPTGYLYRVGRSHGPRRRRLPALLPPGAWVDAPPRMDAVPALGEHTGAILTELGYDTPAIEALRTAGAVG